LTQQSTNIGFQPPICIQHKG